MCCRDVVCAVILTLTVSAKAAVAQTQAAAQDSFAVVHAFAFPGPTAPLSLLQASDGNIYGATLGGGASRLGTVFKMTPAGTITILHEFGGTDGSVPSGGLIQASDGYLYGTTNHRGASGDVTIFKMSPNGGAFATLHTFPGGGQLSRSFRPATVVSTERPSVTVPQATARLSK